MTPISRRVFSGLALGFAGCAGIVGLGSMASAAGKLRLPAGARRLSRVLERTLHDGSMVTVSRVWEVAFAEQGRGVRVSGVQMQAKVDAPASLAALARIEQERSTAQMWPILLSEDGRIVAAGDSKSAADINAALEEAERMIARRPAPGNGQDAQMEYLRTVAEAGGSLLEEMPADLFFPIGTNTRVERELNLPGGIFGSFVATYEASASPAGWLDSARREVSTSIEGSVQSVVETWRLDNCRGS